MSKNNYYINDANKCCPVQAELCIPEKLSVCGEKARQEYKEYLCKEACKHEPVPNYGICDYDTSEVYFLQYRSKKAFYNEWWKQNLYKDIYNFRAHKYKKGN